MLLQRLQPKTTIGEPRDLTLPKEQSVLIAEHKRRNEQSRKAENKSRVQQHLINTLYLISLPRRY
jgi:hypothetical protein